MAVIYEPWFPEAEHHVLTGNSRNNRLKGQDATTNKQGIDILLGKCGNDFLIGGAGTDTFVFDTKLNPKTNVDRITDFNVTEDFIGLSSKIFTKLGSLKKHVPEKPLENAFFKIGNKAKDKNDYIIYNNKTGALFYDADGVGKGKAIKFAQFSKDLELTAKNFVVLATDLHI